MHLTIFYLWSIFYKIGFHESFNKMKNMYFINNLSFECLLHKSFMKQMLVNDCLVKRINFTKQ